MLAWILNLGFAATASDAPVVVPDATPAGGGRGYRYAKGFPRKVIIGGKVYLVSTPWELHQLLQAYLQEQRQALEVAEAVDDKPAARKAKIAVTKTRKRLERNEGDAEQWLARLRAEDEEILVLLH